MISMAFDKAQNYSSYQELLALQVVGRDKN